jgi:hypothetical protein
MVLIPRRHGKALNLKNMYLQIQYLYTYIYLYICTIVHYQLRSGGLGPELNHSEGFEESDVGVEGRALSDEEGEPARVVRQPLQGQREVEVRVGRDGDREDLAPMLRTFRNKFAENLKAFLSLKIQLVC